MGIVFLARAFQGIGECAVYPSNRPMLRSIVKGMRALFCSVIDVIRCVELSCVTDDVILR